MIESKLQAVYADVMFSLLYIKIYIMTFSICMLMLNILYLLQLKLMISKTHS